MDDKTRRELNEVSASSQAWAEAMIGFGRSLHYDRAGKAIGLGDWIALGEDWDYRMVARDEINGVRISTVWIGLDMSVFEREPLIFESMVFDEDARAPSDWGFDFAPSWDNFTRRYSSEEDALAGHAEILEEVRALFDNP